MRLLIDQNLSRSLVRRLADLFPGSTHVASVALETADDQQVWIWAREQSHVLITKDRDFQRAKDFPGPPPKCILITAGNASTDDIEDLLRRSMARIDGFETDPARILRLP